MIFAAPVSLPGLWFGAGLDERAQGEGWRVVIAGCCGWGAGGRIEETRRGRWCVAAAAFRRLEGGTERQKLKS